MRRPLRVALVVLVALPALTARPPIAGAASPPAAARPADVDEAQRHFKLALALYAENDFPAARAELERAYQLVPSYKILYNLGQVLYQLHDYAGAMRTFRAYLSGGAGEIAPPRRAEVEAELRRLAERTGHLDLRELDAATVVLIDDVEIDKDQRATPVTANVGQRRIEVLFPDGDRTTRLVELAAGQTVTVELLLPPQRLSLAAPNRQPPFAPVGVSLSARATDDHPRAPAARSSSLWLGWCTSAVLAAGAGVAGGFAYSASRQVQRDLDAFPADLNQLDHDRRRERAFAFASDGLLVGAALAATLSLYLTLRSDDTRADGTERASR